MALKKSSLKHHNEHFQQPQLQQIPNRINNGRNMHASTSQLAPMYKSEDDELTKNISSEYQEIQLRTLTKWINNQLKQVDEQVTSIASDLKDGRKLLKLLSVVAGNAMLKPEKGNMRIHHLSNVAQALSFLKEQWGNDSLPAIANESVVNGDIKSTLAITFFIMLKYQIHPILKNKATEFLMDTSSSLPLPLPLTGSHDSRTIRPTTEAKLVLLYWVQSQLNDYITNNIIANIQDFSRSWRSGLAFCLLLHRHNPDLTPTLFAELLIQQQPLNKAMWYTLLSLAFDVAESQLEIPRYLNPEDLLVEFPHEPSVIMYISEMYNAMTSAENETDFKREQRLRDIALLKDTDDAMSQHTLLNDPLDSVTPSESSTRADNEDTASQPEELQDAYEQLDFLASCVRSNLEKHEREQDTQRLFDSTYRNIQNTELSFSEKQVLHSEYKQLEMEWEQAKECDRPSDASVTEQEIVPRNEVGEPIHPLDGAVHMADAFERSLARFTDSIVGEHHHIRKQCDLFRRGVTFSQITSAIRAEMDIVQQLMVDSSIDDALVHSLETRIYVVNITLQGVRDEYQQDLLVNSNDPYYVRFLDCVHDLEEQYDKVLHWVNQVRTGFKEAERIRVWISHHIALVEDRNAENDVGDPLAPEVHIDNTKALQLYEDHERLKQDIEGFDSDDMTHLKSSVEMITNSTRPENEMTPADTSTISITLATLNLLNQLTQLLNDRSRFIQLSLLRIKWEDLFSGAVQWVASTDKQMDAFLQGKARWKETTGGDATLDNEGIEAVIETLVFLEREISDFDLGIYTDVLNAYEELEKTYNQKLPDYLELRQVGFEKAFEDVMKRSVFSRQVVEQLLSMISTVDKFQKLRQVGEGLRKQLLEESTAFGDEDIYAEQVQEFKEESAVLITNASACISFPVAPKMSTAIGASDMHDTEITNETVKSTISAYSMALALIADVLDQFLMSRFKITSLQSRVEEAVGTMTRMTNWIDEKISLLQKTDFDTLLFDVKFEKKPEALFPFSASTNEKLHSFDKERDVIVQKFYHMETEELVKCYATVQELEKDIDSTNAVSIDRYLLVSTVEILEQRQKDLKELLHYRGLQSDALKRCKDWENQWLKTSHHIQTIVRKMSDYCFKKALYYPSVENVEKPSYQGDHEIIQSLQSLQERVAELDDKFLSPLQELYVEMQESYHILSDCHSQHKDSSGDLPGVISAKQNDLVLIYNGLKRFSVFTADTVTQRASITEFLLRAQDASQEGEKIKDAFAKKTRFIMANEQDTSSELTQRVLHFKQEIKSVWKDCVKNMLYPYYESEWLKLLYQQQRTPKKENKVDTCIENHPQINDQIKKLLEKKMEGLLSLEKAIDQCNSVYDDANHMKQLVIQYEQEASELGVWISTQVELLRSQYIDISAEVFSSQETSIATLSQSQGEMLLNVDHFERNKVKLLHDNIVQFLDESSKKNMGKTVDISATANKFTQMMEQLSDLKQGIENQSVALDAASKRIQWEKHLKSGVSRLEAMNDQVRQFTLKKNRIVSQDELQFEHVQELQKDLLQIVHQKDDFQNTIYPDIQLSYDVFIQCFPKLSKPIATPDHLELCMESLNGLSIRLQENLDNRSGELDLIKQRLSWEDLVKQALIYLSKEEKRIDHFVEQKARWKNSLNNISTVEAVLLRKEWSTLCQDFKHYKESVIEPLKEKYDFLMNEMAVYYNSTTIRDAFTRKFGDVQKAQHVTNYYLEFSNKVVDQRCNVSSFILETLRLEQSAETIREDLISLNLQNSDDQTISLLESQSEKLQNFKSNVEDVQNSLFAKITFPIRKLEYFSAQTKLHDEASNATIRETVNLRNSRLGELLSSLQQLLESKERISRHRLSLHYYKKQAKLIDLWINSRLQVVLQGSGTLSMEIVELEKLATQISSIEQAMLSSDNVYTALVSAYKKCTFVFEDASAQIEKTQEENQQSSLIEEFHTFVQPTQDRLCGAWEDLLAKTVVSKKENQVNLALRRVQVWVKSLNDLMDVVANLDEHVISNDQLVAHVNELERLEDKEYSNLQSDANACRPLFGLTQLEYVENSLRDGLTTAERIKYDINRLKSKIQLLNLIEKYHDDICNLQEQIQEQSLALITVYENHKQIQMKEHSDTRHTQQEVLVARYKGITSYMTGVRNLFESVCEQYEFLVKQDTSVDIKGYSGMKIAWDNLLEQQSKLLLLISQSSKWLPLLELLDSVRTEVEVIKENVKNISAVDVDALNTAVSRIHNILVTDLKILNVILLEDLTNLESFEQERISLLEQVINAQTSVQCFVKQRERSSLVKSLEEKVDKLYTSVYQQLSVAECHCDRFSLTCSDEQFAKDLKLIRKVIKDSTKIESSCQQEIQTLQVEVCATLIQKFGWRENDAHIMFKQLTQAMDKLASFTSVEKEHMDLATQSHQYLSHQYELSNSIKKYSADLSTVTNFSQQNLSDLECEFESLKESAESLEILYENVLQCKSNITSCKKGCPVTALEQVQERQKITAKQIASTRNLLKKTRQKMNEHFKFQQFIATLHDLVLFIEDMAEKVCSFAIDRRSIDTVETQFNKMCSDFYRVLSTKRSAVKEFIDNYAEHKDVKLLNSKVLLSIANLESAIELKKKEFGQQDMSEFLRIGADFNKNITSLVSVINKSSPNCSNVVSNKFVKSDLQLLLRNLVKNFKQYKHTINDILDKAILESQRSHLVENDHVKEKLQKMKRRWAKTQSAASARERELKTCIHQLDHEFFTQLAMAKTGTTHKPSQSTSTRQMGPLSPIPSSKSENKVQVKRKPYVPNPNNELDVKLSQIINSSLCKVTVKVVPDQIGKYWFGDVNPRLVYCRILPSKLVMVRVGGGWVELSKFLREHGFIDGSSSRPSSVNETPFQEIYSQNKRPDSPANRITIRGGGFIQRSNSSSSLRRSSSKTSLNSPKSPLPGYIEGNRFVSIDENGNQHYVRMKKAKDNATTPIISKKKN